MAALLAFLVVGLAAAHPGIVREGANNGTIESYHIHVQYLKGAPNSTARAMRLRDAYIDRWGSRSCSGLFDQPERCMYAIEDHHDGIFVSGNWAAYVPLADYERIVSWTVQYVSSPPPPKHTEDVAVGRHRGDLSILFHPNSGQHLHDHFRWSTWIGRVYPMNVDCRRLRSRVNNARGGRRSRPSRSSAPTAPRASRPRRARSRGAAGRARNDAGTATSGNASTARPGAGGRRLASKVFEL